MKFQELAIYFEKIESTASRLEITELLASLFKELTPYEMGKTMYLLQGRVVPLFEKVEFGMAEKSVIKSALVALQVDRSAFMHEFEKQGDVGRTIEIFKKELLTFEQQDLDILEVYDALHTLACSNGTGSQEVKTNILVHLFRELDSLSCRFLARIPMGTMRLGFSDMTVLDAFSWMLTGGKTLRPQIEKAYHVRPDLGYIGNQLKAQGIDGLEQVKPTLFTPILMMRAERTNNPAEIIEKLGECVIEPKYDGFRLQVHYQKKSGEVRLYSRNLEDVSAMYPDVIAGIQKEITADELILEGEAIGFDPHTGNFLPFQETVQRKRKYDIAEKAKEIPLKLFVFEILYANGTSYIQSPFMERRNALEGFVAITGDIFQDTITLAPQLITSDAHALEIYFDDAITRGLEGVMAKKKEGVYQPGARGSNWIKFKRSYSAKIEDTIDCVVMGYDYGRGKRADFGIGAFLVGVYDEEQDMFVTVAKIGTGLTDEEWKDLKSTSAAQITEKQPALYLVDKQMSVDIWIKPSAVVEIKADEITRSPVHTAGRVMKASKNGNALQVDIPGFALRFPRLQRFRTDRRPEEATTVSEVKSMFEHQVNTHS
ncbi:ATP-dependent DNA ligase [Candidatus Roizmanbacteria bacterium]|nr:ATP-dependent DNA ligase [Candidatus Roizmanbacteria bacterium]